MGALGSIVTFIGTTSIIPFLPDGWAHEAGGFPIMTLPLGFLMKDVLFLAASFYLLKQDVMRAAGMPLLRNPFRRTSSDLLDRVKIAQSAPSDGTELMAIEGSTEVVARHYARLPAGSPRHFKGTAVVAFLDMLGFSADVKRNWRAVVDGPVERLMNVKRMTTGNRYGGLGGGLTQDL